MKKILITGGAGYIGSKLATYLLSKNYKVTVLDSQKYTNDSLNHLFYKKNFTFLKCDVRNKKILNKFIKKNDIIIPLAALVGAPSLKALLTGGPVTSCSTNGVWPSTFKISTPK